MKLLKRNLKALYFCEYLGSEPILDEDGWETGEKQAKYSDPIKVMCNISVDKGNAQSEYFGVDTNYDRAVIVEGSCSMSETSVCFVDKEPEFEDGVPLYNYVVTKKAVGLNETLYAISRVQDK